MDSPEAISSLHINNKHQCADIICTVFGLCITDTMNNNPIKINVTLRVTQITLTLWVVWQWPFFYTEFYYQELFIENLIFLV